jgi:hypothetical protein
MAEDPNRTELKAKAHKVSPRNYEKQSNAGLQLRRAISIQPAGTRLLENRLSRRQLQGFVGLRRNHGLLNSGTSALF